jgi:archaemetzincin
VEFDSAHPAFGEDPEVFESTRPPGPNDWLSRFPHTEVGFDEYVALRPTGQRGPRNILVLMPRTLLTRSLVPRLPGDAICLLGVTFEDLYPDKPWNFVFGEASLDERVGVYSLARFFREFGHPPASLTSDPQGLERSFKILAHETGHMFSLHHCCSFECLMNGSNSLDEADRAPLHLGSRCLRKLQHNIRFDITSRYRCLLTLYEQYGLTQEAAWTRLRLQRLAHSVARAGGGVKASRR